MTASASGTSASQRRDVRSSAVAAAYRAPTLFTESSSRPAPASPNGESAPTKRFSMPSAYPDATAVPSCPASGKLTWPGATMGLSSATDPTGTSGCRANIA